MFCIHLKGIGSLIIEHSCAMAIDVKLCQHLYGIDVVTYLVVATGVANLKAIPGRLVRTSKLFKDNNLLDSFKRLSMAFPA